MRLPAILICLAVSGCGTAQLERYDSPYFTYEHGSSMFSAANDYAQRYCAQAGRYAKHLGTDSPPGGMSLSRFECVSR